MRASDGADADVPSPIDLRDPDDARAWVESADAKRPWRGDLRRQIAELLRGELAAPLRVLELGAGPGVLAQTILETCDVERYVAFDFSPPFLAMCRARVGSHPAVQLVCGDFKQPEWAALVGGPFDAVVAMQAVHELRHKRHAPQLYREVARVLRPGGVLVVCDHQPFDDTAHCRALYATDDEQLAALRAAGFDPVAKRAEVRGMYICLGVASR